MKNILLTSTGFENKNIESKFLELLDKNVAESKVLFIITAAIDIEAVQILSKCAYDLLNCGIKKENIIVYNMHKPITPEELEKIDVIYVCGGNTKYLVERMNESNFKQNIDKFISDGGIYIGVSAGSVSVSGKYENNLGFIKNKIDVHCEKGSTNGKIVSGEDIYLTDNQAIYINDDEMIIFE